MMTVRLREHSGGLEMSGKCKICEVCAHPGSDKTLYPEDSRGIPFCNSQGPLSVRSRQILVNREVAYDKVVPGAGCPR